MKTIITLLLVLSSAFSYSQTGNTQRTEDVRSSYKFVKIDTVEGKVSYFDVHEQRFEDAIKLDSLFEYEKEVIAQPTLHDPNGKGLGVLIYWLPRIIKGTERNTFKIIVQSFRLEYELDIKKPYTFINKSDLHTEINLNDPIISF